MELTRDEELAMLTALSKRVKERLDELKGEAKLALMDMNAEQGIDRRAIRANGQKVGEVGITYASPGPVIDPARQSQAMDYLRELGLVAESPKRGWEKRFAKAGDGVMDVETGELVDFLEWSPGYPKFATIRGCEPGTVLEAMQDRIGGESVIGLLEE